jgi:hypothetical protein
VEQLSGHNVSDVIACAVQAQASGLSVVPPAQDGTKRPISAWRRYMSEAASLDQVLSWYDAAESPTGLGLVTGSVSGGLELLEFEGRARPEVQLFMAGAAELGLSEVVDRIRFGYCEFTPAGGVHLLYRCEKPVTTKLARDEAGEVLVETKGEGGYVIVAPSFGAVHPSGKPWCRHRGGFDTIATIATEEREELHRLCRSFDRYPKTARALGSQSTPGHRPGDEWAADTSWSQILEPKGWQPLYTAGDGNQHWRRPGKDRGTSATVSENGTGVLYVFSSSAPPFEPDQCYTKFGALAVLEHGGDMVATARELGRRGFGHQEPEPDDDEAPPRPLQTLRGLLDADEPEYDWLVPNLLERTDRLMVTGAWGYGKSTFLRQLGVGVALGLNTLSTNPLERHHRPWTVLLIDLENSQRQLRREFRKLLRAVDEHNLGGVLERFYVESRPEGLVLDSPKDREGDRRWLIDAIAVSGADVLIIGPLYKMIDGDPNEEIPNRNLAKWMDRLRREYDLTILIEAHTTHREQRPSGWSGWRRWPEFGVHLRENGSLDHWRGQREERQWPLLLVKGVPGDWLWKTGSGTTLTPPSDPHEDLIVLCKVEVLRHLNKATRALTANELVALLGRRRSSVWAAIARLQQDGALDVTTVELLRSNGRPYSTEAFTTSSTWRAEQSRSQVPHPLGGHDPGTTLFAVDPETADELDAARDRHPSNGDFE